MMRKIIVMCEMKRYFKHLLKLD